MSNRREIDLRFNAPQLAVYPVLFDEHGQVQRGRSLFLGWGRGCGKSWFRRQIWWLLVALLDGKKRAGALEPVHGVRIRCLAPTLKQWKLNNWDGILQELTGKGKWAWLGAKLDAQSGQIRFPGGSAVTPFPATVYNARTARGMRTDVLDADELDDIDGEVYDAIAVPWLSEPWSLRIEILCGTPTRGRHGLWWRCWQAGRLGEKLRVAELSDEEALKLPEVETIAARFGDHADSQEILEALRSSYCSHATYRDVPETVSRQQVAKAKANTLPATFEREWEANADAGEGLVYPFIESFHVREPPPDMRFREYHVGNDHGYVDPGVMILFGVYGHGDDAVAWALDEIYEPGIQPSEWDERAKPWSTATFWPDPSRPDRIASLRAMGIAVGVADGSVNKILPGVARMADMLHPRAVEGGDEKWCRFYVSPKCRNLIREFGLYRRKKLPDGSFAEEPEDKNNHAMDASRYFAYGRFGAPPNYRFEIRG